MGDFLMSGFEGMVRKMQGLNFGAQETEAEQLQDVALALKRLEIMERAEAFEPNTPGSKPSTVQAQIIEDMLALKYMMHWIVGGNQSGKSQVAAFLMAQYFRELTWQRPDRWGKEPLQLLWAGRTTQHIMHLLLPKLYAYMEPGEWKANNIGNVTQSVVHQGNGNTIILLSHHCASQAWEKTQGYVSHVAFCDELPQSWEFIEQMQRRIQIKTGVFGAFFTPIRPITEVRRMVESAKPPTAKAYRLLAVDNPSLSAFAKEGVLAGLSTASNEVRANRLEGAWTNGDNVVFQITQERLLRPVPVTYSPMWEHLEGSDPAIQSEHGLVVLTRDPKTGIWWVVHAQKFSGIETASPKVEIENIVKATRPFRIVKRVCDPANQGWYMSTARELDVYPSYVIPYDKGRRRPEMLRGLMAALGHTLFISPTTNCEALADEILRAEWKDGETDKIKGSSKYHLIDALIYAWDERLADLETTGPVLTWEEEIRAYNRKLAEEHPKTLAEQMNIRRAPIRGRGRWTGLQ
jgi:hypothetical protein